jgi:HD superfamily phosphohydrolase
MKERFSFDHEIYLHNLLTGKTDDPGMEKCQIFMRRGLKLMRIVQSDEGRRLGLDIFRIADMAVGKGDYGSLVKADLDLDNIDNVIRAATAMGIRDSDSHDAETLAASFRISDRRIIFHASSIDKMRKWRRTRYTLYDMIYGDIEDFALQTMLKCAIELLIDTDDKAAKLLPVDWRLTDEELIRDRIMHNDEASSIMERITLYKPYECVGVFELPGTERRSLLENYMPKMERVASDFFGVECIANYTIDKRHRTLAEPVSQPLTRFFGDKRTDMNEEEMTGLFIFIFSTGKRSRRYREPDPQFLSKLHQAIPSGVDLKPMRRVTETYPRLARMGWDL